MTWVLDRIYRLSGALAAFFLVMIVVITLAQIVGRFLDIQIRDADIFAGFSMAASSFLALAYTLRTGGHIRVTLLISCLKGKLHRAAEGFCLVVATVMVGCFAWFAIAMVMQSYEFGDMSTGLVRVPMWIPQLGMVTGAVLLTVAFIEECVRFLQGKEQTYGGGDDAHTE